MTMIPFNKPYMTGKELHYISQAYNNEQLAGDGSFTQKCHAWLEQNSGCQRALLTHSCTAALEMAALLSEVRPGDEVIMPSYTFVSTANAFALRGAVPVFVDICDDTLNIDERLIEQAITQRTKVIVPVHYAGVGCAMEKILEIAETNNLMVVEDAAQGLMAKYHGKPLGTFGQFGTVSFHETKNIISGEGGALVVNDMAFVERAEIIREKGTNRSQFFRGQVDKYTWVDIGSSYLPGEIIAAFLFAQFEEAEKITQKRLEIWSQYHEALEELESMALIRRPVIPEGCAHNAHMYYIRTRTASERGKLLNWLEERGVQAVFHYVPLHSSPAGTKYGVISGTLDNTQFASETIIRLPLWIGFNDVEKVVSIIRDFFH